MKGVLENAKRQRKKYRESPAWLQCGVAFDNGHHLTEEHQSSANKLFEQLIIQDGYKIYQKKKDFETLLANLFHQTRHPIIVSLNRNDWVKTQYNNTSYFIIDLIHLLYKQKFIDMKIGCDTIERMTRIWPTEKLLECFPEYNKAVFYEPVNVIELREFVSNKLITYKETGKTYRIRKILERANRVNGEADIRYLGYKLSGFLIAVFKEKFTLYGRLHTRGFRHYQGFSEQERAEITINNNPVVERDFKALHPYLLYASEGIQYKGDPYSMIDKRPEARPFLKQILLCMLNAKDRLTAERAANYWLRNNHQEREQLRELEIKRSRPLMEQFFEAHRPIAHHFCNGKETGMRVMNMDAKIALDIINYFSKKGIPILSIHDSFIVELQHEKELVEVMKKTYRKHTNFRCEVH